MRCSTSRWLGHPAGAIHSTCGAACARETLDHVTQGTATHAAIERERRTGAADAIRLALSHLEWVQAQRRFQSA
jgi:hypothetical protein